MQLLSHLLIAAQAVNAVPNLWSSLMPRVAVNPQSFVTNQNQSYQLSSFTAPVTGSGSPTSRSVRITLQVNDSNSNMKQTIVGFGAAITDTTVDVINSLPSPLQNQIWTLLLTPSGQTSSGFGANFSLFRHTVGSSDLSAPPAYTYDDNNGTADVNLSNFTLGTRGLAMANTLKFMKTFSPAMKILGTPWSPPGWMKANGALIGGNTGLNYLNPTYYSQHAQYLVQYLKRFNAIVPIDAITIQNEPLNFLNKNLPSMNVTANVAVDLINNHIGPAIQSVTPTPQIWAYDHNTDHPEYPQQVVSQTSSSLVQAAAWHCYTDKTAGWTPLTAFHQQFPTIDQYMTECATINGSGSAWYGASNFTIGPLQNWANGVMAWTLATNTTDGPYLNDGVCNDCHGLVIVDTNAGTYSLTTDFYTMAQYSRWMPRGAVVMDVTGGVVNSTGMLRSVATLNPDGTTKTIVFHNTFSQDYYITTTFASGAQSYSGLVMQKSVTTWVLPK